MAKAKRAPQAGVKRAIDKDELTLFYQPIHELDSRRIVSAEALLRAVRETGEIRSAVPIAAAAERGPDLFRMDSLMMQEAFRDMGRWQAVAPDVGLNFNLSAREFESGGRLAVRVKKLIAGLHIDPRTIQLEITETLHIERPKQTMHVLLELKEMGFGLWLDDFGTGHSSISSLLTFPLDGLKVPAEFVRGLPADHRSLAITRSIITLAHELEMKVIAEGIENQDHLATLRDLKCDYIQGFLFSKPMTIDDFVDTLQRHPQPRKRNRISK